jgi:hypothetical protein
MKYHVVTVISDSNKYEFTSYLLRSCQYFDIPLNTLIASPNYSDHNLKDQILLQFLDRIPRGDYILFVDGYDSFFLTSLQEIQSKFERSNREILFSAEMNCWPDELLKEQYISDKNHFQSPYKYLNSGGFIGPNHLIKHLLQTKIEAPSQYRSSNQYISRGI